MIPQEQPNQVEGEHTYETQASHNVTFVEDDKLGSNNDMFHIFDDDNDFNQSGNCKLTSHTNYIFILYRFILCLYADVEGDDDQPESPSTVRERASVELLPEDNTPDGESLSGHKTPPAGTGYTATCQVLSSPEHT